MIVQWQASKELWSDLEITVEKTAGILSATVVHIDSSQVCITQFWTKNLLKISILVLNIMLQITVSCSYLFIFETWALNIGQNTICCSPCQGFKQASWSLVSVYLYHPTSCLAWPSQNNYTTWHMSGHFVINSAATIKMPWCSKEHTCLAMCLLIWSQH